MDSKNELWKEDQFLPKIEPINAEFIKKEKNEDEEYFVVSGIVESFKVDKSSVKKEVFDNENCSSSNV